ncbi:YceI family protein [Chryseolinea soli]|uniref:Polyisoprenoid-binding protein n=1 Tax=Chryseolinea soli TaxID=2321403 RepID=A0A385SK11_9BACT|nr:YceI family protein [Chryseolinea soli]AYB29730.1 polyisoprenoid-binding protein [Chryseolinea soli]
MKKNIAFFVLLLSLSSQVSFGQTWSLDKSHAKLGFSVTHLLVSNVEGNFKSFDAKITSAQDDFSNAVIELTADINSINTDDDQRDGHLKSPDFFDVAKFSTLTFKSTSFKKVADKKYKVEGNLTMHGVTKKVELDVTFNGTAVHPYTKKTIAGFKVSGIIKRSDFAIGAATPGAVVSDEVEINTNAEFVKG